MSLSSESIYRLLYFTPPTNVPLISFNFAGKVLIVLSVRRFLSMSFEFEQWGGLSCVFEFVWSCRDVSEDSCAFMRCLTPKLQWCMISECEYSSLSSMPSKLASLSSSLQLSSLRCKEI